MDEWAVIPEFPDYSVSQHGKVINNHTQRILALTKNQYNLWMVGLVRDGVQHKRSLSLLVAEAFLDPPINDRYNSIINLDGDRRNCSVDNLMWRPRWFAQKYHKQFKPDYRRLYQPGVLVRDIKTGEVYDDSMDIVTRFGVLEMDIHLAIMNKTHVFPTWQRFEWVDE